jgi:hypothetical protein
MAFAIIINKAQEQSLYIVRVNMQKPFSKYKQLYITPFRAMTVAGVRILMKLDAQRLTKNNVF